MITRMNIFYCEVTLLILLVVSTSAQQPQWRLARGTENVYTAAIASSWGSPETLYAIGARQIDAWTSYGIFLKSTDAGESWDSISSLGTDVGAIKVDPSNSQILYTSHIGLDPQSNDISMSTDGGVTWNVVFRGRRFPAPVVEVDPVDNKTVYVAIGPGALWRTSDQGKTWEWSGGVPTNTLTSVAIDPVNDSIIWAGTHTSILKSTDRGASWFEVMQNPWWVWDQIAINPKDPNIVYVSFFDTTAGVWKTTDGGTTWKDTNGNLPPVNRHIWRIALNPRDPEEMFLGVGTPTLDPNPLLFRSTDGGTHWSAFSDGLPVHGHTESILIDTVTNRIYAGGTSGIYVCDCLTSVDPDSPTTPESFTLLQNYPNPFNPRTTIEFLMARQDNVALDVLDLLGKKVSTLVDGKVVAGDHRVMFDASMLPSGVYFYRLRTSVVTYTRKMMVIK